MKHIGCLMLFKYATRISGKFTVKNKNWESVHVKPCCSAQEENALKAKLRRLCEKKSGGRLQVPQWLHDEWLNGDHLTMARQYQSCNFDKDTIPSCHELPQHSQHVHRASETSVVANHYEPSSARPAWPIPDIYSSKICPQHFLAGPLCELQEEDSCEERGQSQQGSYGLVYPRWYGKGLEVVQEPRTQPSVLL